MATKDYASKILEQLESGTADIWDRYQKMIAASDAQYDSMIQSADQTYRAQKNQTSAKARIQLSNNLEQLAAQGLTASGASLQARLSSNASLLNALSQLSVQNSSEKSKLALQKQTAAAELETKRSRDLASYRSDLMKSYLDQLNEDREYEATQAQRAFENRIKEETLALQKQAAAASQRNSSSGSSGSSGGKNTQSAGLTPSKTPYDYLQEIVEKYTTVDSNKKYKTINRTAVATTLSQLVKDPYLAEDYRHELYVYARTLGYLN